MALEQGYEIENFAAIEGIDFSCKPTQLIITNLKVIRNCYLGYNMYSILISIIDLNRNRGVRILFILPLTEKVLRNKNYFFQISINKCEANQLFSVLRFLFIKRLMINRGI